MNKILKIEEVINLELTSKHNGDLGISGMLNTLRGYGGYDGYKVETEQGLIYILIDNDQSCCEDFGYLSTDDDVQKYVGSELIDIELTDTQLTTEKLEQLEYMDAGSVQFVTFKTDKGVFQLAVYNSHNGYYGHGIYIFKNDECLLNSCL